MQIGLIGLGTMGANLARNAARKGALVTVFNRTAEKTDAFLKDFGSEGAFIGAKSLQEFVGSLKVPRSIFLMVKAGEAVDQLIIELLPMLSPGDMLIDAGNSHYRDTEARANHCLEQGIHFIGMGVSGGEEGALLGPSMMLGGDAKAVEPLLPLLRDMAADDGKGGKCVTLHGPGGSGHFVKMVHNGIEYGIMQLLAESYHLLRQGAGFSNAGLQEIFEEWNSGYLQSFLVEITSKIFGKKNDEGEGDLIDQIIDSASQKGTGKWTVEAGFDYGVSIPTITAAVDARIVSSGRAFRLSESTRSPLATKDLPAPGEFADLVRTALECSVINTYAQGWQLLGEASTAEKWNLNLAEIARVWRGGCIIRSAVLGEFEEIFSGQTAAAQRVKQRFDAPSQLKWREIVAWGMQKGIPLPAMSASLSYFDGYRTARLPSNLIAAQRDFFGVHGFERLDKPGLHHADWSSAS